MAGTNQFLPTFDRRPSPGKSRSRRTSQTQEADIVADIQRQMEEAVHRADSMDKGPAPKVSPPSGRMATYSKRRKPVFKGGLVTGKRSPYGLS